MEFLHSIRISFQILIILYKFSAPKRTEEVITTQWKRHNMKEEIKKRAGGKTGEMKTTDQIVRERLRLELIKNREKVNKKVKDHNRKRTSRQQKHKQRR